MLRIICTAQSCVAAANVPGAQAQLWSKTFLVDAPELEAWLLDQGGFEHKWINGYEVVVEEPKP